MLADPAQLLLAWEEGSRAAPAARTAVLVRRAGAAADLEAALDLPLGQSAALAARLYAETFGAQVEGILRCAACGEELDVTIPLDALEGPAAGAEAEAAGLTVRAMTSRDLLAAAASGDARRELLRRCVRRPGGEPVAPEELDEERLAAVEAAAERLAGAAGTVLRGRCPGCGADATAPLDVGALLWQQVARAARALLAEVAALAAAFGWSEPEVLALAPRRRREYLRLAGAAA